MKKKIFSILFALVLVLTLGLVTAVPVGAAGPVGAPFFTTDGNGTAEYSIEQAYSLDYSVKLYVENGWVDWAEVSIPVDIAIENITELKFREYIDSYTPNGWTVNVILGIDVDGNGIFASDLPAWHRHDIDETIALDGDTFIEFEYVADPSMDTWTERDALTNYALWLPLDDDLTTEWFAYGNAYNAFKEWLDGESDTSRIDKGMLVKEVILQIGGAGSWMNETAYVDDITINDVLYELEPATGAVDMTAIYPTPVIGISVSPASVSFGDVEPGIASGPQTVTVTNTGTVAEDFDASLRNISEPDVYTEGLKIAAKAVRDWTAPGVAAQTSVEPVLILTVPDPTAPGTYRATLVFWAEAS